MTERPLRFSGQMVRAILDGRKTQTRIAITSLAGFGPVTDFGQTTTPGYDWCFRDRRLLWHEIRNDAQCISRYCPHGKPRDRLWVREKFQFAANGCIQNGHGATYVCFPDGSQKFRNGGYFEYQRAPFEARWPSGWKWKPSIHMPRWASRITLEITDVHIEKLREIDENDVIAEGLESVTGDGSKPGPGYSWHGLGFHGGTCIGESKAYHTPDRDGKCLCVVGDRSPPVCAFREVWDRSHGKRAPWESNPWVWVISFRKVVE